MGEAGSHVCTCEVSRAPAPDRHTPDTIPPPEPVSRPRRPARPVPPAPPPVLQAPPPSVLFPGPLSGPGPAPGPAARPASPSAAQACPEAPPAPTMVVAPGPQASSASSQSDATRPTAEALPRTACPDWLAGRRPQDGHWLRPLWGPDPDPGQDSNGDWPVLPGELAFHWASLWAGSGSCSASAGSCALAPPGPPRRAQTGPR